MKMIIQTPDFKATQELTAYVQDNVSKLNLFNNKIIETRVLLKLDKSDSRENKICEIKLFISGDDLFASRQSSSFEDAVMQTIEALKRQLERKKTSRKVRVDNSIASVEPEDNEI